MSDPNGPVAGQEDDLITVDGEVCPGIVVLSGFKRPTEWDVKKGKGTKGATITLSQLPPAKGTLTFLLWTRAHRDAWDRSFRARFKFDPTKKTKNAVSIYHSTLAELDITAIVTENIGAREHQGKGLYHIVVDVLEFIPVSTKSAVGTPNGSTANGAGKAGSTGKSDDPIADAQQAQIAALLKQANA